MRRCVLFVILVTLFVKVVVVERKFTEWLVGDVLFSANHFHVIYLKWKPICSFIQQLTLVFFLEPLIICRNIMLRVLSGYGFCITLPTSIPRIFTQVVQRGTKWFKARPSTRHRHRRREESYLRLKSLCVFFTNKSMMYNVHLLKWNLWPHGGAWAYFWDFLCLAKSSASCFLDLVQIYPNYVKFMYAHISPHVYAWTYI